MNINEIQVKPGKVFPFGVTRGSDSDCIQVSAWNKDSRKCNLVLYYNGMRKVLPMFSMETEGASDIFSVSLQGQDLVNQLAGWEYMFEIDGREIVDPYVREVTGREEFGKKGKIHGVFNFDKFDWSGENAREVLYRDMVMYQCHVRGFTKHESSGVSSLGTFRGIMEKIPYLKKLGVNTLLLMPCYEFDETEKNDKSKEKGKKINYWGYTKDAFFFAPKQSYGSGQESVVTEYKKLILELHKNGMNFLMDMHFQKKSPDYMVDCLRYYVMEYHVDGFLINQDVCHSDWIVNDPILRNIKLLGTGWQVPQEDPRDLQTGKNSPRKVKLANFNDGFMIDARRFLKSDEGQVGVFYQRFRGFGSQIAEINYITQKNGFTLWDLVTYDRKHNENNGERNLDGTDYNYSWNCGTEGTTRRKGVLNTRRQQQKNAMAMLLLSQGTPMILMGDEFGNSQKGNNNAYCQDNLTTWLDWRLLDKNQEIFDFTKDLLEFRRKEKIYHCDSLQGVDYLGCGAPDVSCHGIEPWVSNFVNYSRELGVLYYGTYFQKDKKTKGKHIYIGFNMHWESHEFFLPVLENNQGWRVVFDTSNQAADGKKVKKGKYIKDKYVFDPRTIVVLESVPGPKNKTGN